MKELSTLNHLLTSNDCKFKSVLDVGCGECFTNLISIYNQNEIFQCQRFVGVDIKFKDWDQDTFLETIWPIVGGNYYKIKEEFSKKFTIEYAELENDIHLPTDRFDLIILSNILHLFEVERAKFLYNYFLSKLKDGGYMLVRVASENHKGWLGPTRHQSPKWGFSQAELEEFINYPTLVQEESLSNRQVLLKKQQDLENNISRSETTVD